MSLEAFISNIQSGNCVRLPYLFRSALGLFGGFAWGRWVQDCDCNFVDFDILIYWDSWLQAKKKKRKKGKNENEVKSIKTMRVQQLYQEPDICSACQRQARSNLNTNFVLKGGWGREEQIYIIHFLYICHIYIYIFKKKYPQHHLSSGISGECRKSPGFFSIHFVHGLIQPSILFYVGRNLRYLMYLRTQ